MVRVNLKNNSSINGYLVNKNIDEIFEDIETVRSSGKRLMKIFEEETQSEYLVNIDMILTVSMIK